jgi:hypothetical protein
MTQLLITQAELSEINRLERDMASMKHQLEELRSSVDVMLREGIQVEEGRFEAVLVKCISRPISWKTVCLEQLGRTAFDAIRRTYRTTVYRKLVVREHAILPLWRQHRDGSDQNPN